MQINTQNQYLYKNHSNQTQTTQSQEDSKTFGEYLGIVVPTEEKLKQLENGTYKKPEDSTPTLDRGTRVLALAAKFANDIEKAMKQQISDVSKLDKAIFNQVRMESSLESSPEKIQDLFNETIFALQNDRVKSGNLSNGEFESQAQFEARKAKTIDILSEILQGIKA